MIPRPRSSGDSRELEYFQKRVGRRYAGCRVSSFDVGGNAKKRAAADKTRAYLNLLPDNLADGRNLVFVGPPGTGKDHLMVSCCKVAINSGYRVEWTDGAEMYGAMRDWIDDGRNESDELKGWTQPDVLAISDPVPPVGKLTEHQRSMLFRIIDRRYRDFKSTWITINAKGIDEADERIATNIVDRISHGAAVVSCNWPSYRRA